ncbi:MAG: hypothetical protein SynsKO_04940 [Synoicihabitans sp.]
MKIHVPTREFGQVSSFCGVSVWEILSDPRWIWLQIAVTWALVGLIWTVQIVIYPQLATMRPDGFAEWHRAYTHRMGWVVGPLMLAEMGLATLWVLVAPGSTAAWMGLSLVGVNALSTIALQVPIHRKLSRGWRAETIATLVATNWIRTAAWSIRGLILLGFLVQE